MTSKEYRQLVQNRARATGEDPDLAMSEFTENLRQMASIRRESERLYAGLLELGRQYAWYRKAEPYDPERLLSRDELGRRYAELKAQHRAVKRTLSVRCNRANSMLGGMYFRHGLPIDDSVGCAQVSTTLTDVGVRGEVIVLIDPDDGEPIFLEML